MGTGYNGAGAPEEGDARQDMGTFWAKPFMIYAPPRSWAAKNTRGVTV